MTTCVLCPIYHPAGKPRPPHWPPVCDGCRERARAELTEIPQVYALLPAALEPGRGHVERVATSSFGPIPVNVDVITLIGPGTTYLTAAGQVETQVGELPTAVLLDQWVRDWIDLRGQKEHAPVPTVTTLVDWLLLRLDWALDEHPAVDAFCNDINHALRAIRSAARSNHYRGEKAGKCPMRLRDDTRCDTQLRVDPYLDRIQCSRCGTAWPRVKWLALRAAQDGDAA